MSGIKTMKMVPWKLLLINLSWNVFKLTIKILINRHHIDWYICVTIPIDTLVKVVTIVLFYKDLSELLMVDILKTFFFVLLITGTRLNRSEWEIESMTVVLKSNTLQIELAWVFAYCNMYNFGGKVTKSNWHGYSRIEIGIISEKS